MDVEKVHPGEKGARSVHVNVRVVEPGRSESAGEIDFSRRSPLETANLLVRSDGEDALGFDRDSFDPGMRALERVDSAAYQKDVGRILSARSGADDGDDQCRDPGSHAAPPKGELTCGWQGDASSNNLASMTHWNLILALALASNAAAAGLRFDVRYAAGLRTAPLDGRLLVMLSKEEGDEPRFQIDTSLETQQIFGADVNELEAGEAAILDGSAIGYPVERLAEVPAGEYIVQALVHVYETFHRADGRVLKLPMDDGEGQQWDRSPGNLYSTPRRLRIDPAADQTISLTLDRIIPPIDPPEDTKFIKHVRIQSEKLSRFWGRPMHLGAIVLLPEGFDEHPDARYPVLYVQGHFTSTFRGFRESPPEPGLSGDGKIEAEYGYRLYQDWTSGRLPRMLIVITQHANPYYDDSYGVNSENLGPYGDAIVEELTPYVEKKFRAIGEGWARVLMGGSTGGWIALAQQVFYPDFFNGAWCHCPDSVDFREYQMVDVYKNENAYWMDSEWKKVPRVDRREVNGDLTATMEDANRYELVLGENARSGRPVGRLAGGLWAGRSGRLSAADLEQADRSDRSRGRRLLEGELRPPRHPRKAMVDARPQARGQDPHQDWGRGPFLSRAGGSASRRVPGIDERAGPRAVLRRERRVGRRPRALLQRRSVRADADRETHDLPAALAGDGGAHVEDRAERRGRHELALLKSDR